MPMDMVAQATRKPKADSSDPKNLEILRRRLPKRSHAVAGGRCSGSFFLLLNPSPKETMVLLLSDRSGDPSAVESSFLNTARNHFSNRLKPGKMNLLRDMVPSSTLESA